MLSCLNTLVLSSAEYEILNKYHRFYLTKSMKLYDKTPESLLLFAAGCLSLEALVHLRVLSLFGMICRLPMNILHRMADKVLSTENDKCGSWFVSVRLLYSKYGLPSPILLLSLQLSKENYKQMVKSKIISYWESKLRFEASQLKSLKYFDPNFASLIKPHPVLIMPGSNPYEVSKSVILLRMLSGHYRDDYLLRHFSGSNNGSCALCSNPKGDLEHYFCSCSRLASLRTRLLS